MANMRIDVVSVFPRMIESFVCYGVVRRAVEDQLLTIKAWDVRDFTGDRHRTVDDKPYGGGPGMLMMAEPLCKALRAAKARQRNKFLTVYLSPQGQRLDQRAVNRLADLDGLVLLAGRYKGVDERVVELEVDEEWSLGDYVISGGEAAAMVLIDAVVRQRDGVLGDEDSAKKDSFMTGLLDCPHYTRPAEYEDQAVPEVLLGGDHEAIRRWRLKHALGRTLQRRAELLQQTALNDEEQALLSEYANENGVTFPPPCTGDRND